MARIVVIGAGVVALGAAMLLAGDGHQVIVLERDPEEPPGQPADAWDHWQRPGLNQFRLPHAFLGGFRSVLDDELPEVSKALEAAGALRLNFIRDVLPATMTGGWRDGDESYEWLTARRPVLEAVFDEVALRGGLHRLGAAVALSDAHAALREVISIFCDFWSFDPGALGLLHAAGSSNQEFAVSVTERNERRRRLFAAIVRRMKLRPKAQRDLVDTLFALTSFPFFAQLAGGGRSAAAASRII